jgi:Na+/melibiose symporter-like transporter|tara:strand:- start:1018 stop:1551 length:534 start_codon:yes stop_codon:yes gene_type:complete
MTMSDTFIVVAVIAGLGMSLTAIGLLMGALFPNWVARSECRLRRMPVRTIFAGLGLALVVVPLVFVLLANPNGQVKFIGGIGLTGFLIVSFAGTSGFARLIGTRLPSPSDQGRPWKGVIRGWVVLFLSFLLPVLGWFVILPGTLVIGLGAAVLGFIRSRPVEPEKVQERIESEGAVA